MLANVFFYILRDRHLRDLINLRAARGSIRSVITARNESVTCRCFENLGAERQVSKGVPRPRPLLLLLPIIDRVYGNFSSSASE